MNTFKLQAFKTGLYFFQRLLNYFIQYPEAKPGENQ